MINESRSPCPKSHVCQSLFRVKYDTSQLFIQARNNALVCKSFTRIMSLTTKLHEQTTLY